MSTSDENLPPTLAGQIAGIPAALVPATLKALDRLIAGAVDVPVAWLAQQKAKIDAQTEAYKAVEAGIAGAAASLAAADPEVVNRAVDVLVRKAYRKQMNREAVGAAAVDELKSCTEPDDATVGIEVPEPDEEWLNVFERYAEEASTERMQKLWGRVLAGELRKRGSFSMRSLRFLSEFSQADAVLFANFCENVFGECVPMSLVKPDADADIRDLLSLKAADLIEGAESGLQLTLTFDEHGFAWLREGKLLLLFTGAPGEKIVVRSYTLTPIGRELIGLLDRDVRACARKIANAIRTPQIKAAHLAIPSGPHGVIPLELLWNDPQPSAAPVDAAAAS